MEKLRDKFVNFEGQKTLKVLIEATFDTINKYEKEIIQKFCQKISENIGKELIENLTPNFTTSTTNTLWKSINNVYF